MNKIGKRIGIFVMLMCIWGAVGVYAQEDELSIYREKLEQINGVLGTEYKIPNEQEIECTELTYDELIAFYQNMSMDEFEGYILELHENNTTEEITTDYQLTYDNKTTNVMSRSANNYYNTLYYQSSSNNFLCVVTNNIVIGGTPYYQNVVGVGCNAEADGYPFYSPTGLTYTPSKDSTQLTCKIYYVKHLSATVIDAAQYSITTTFTATSGDAAGAKTFTDEAMITGDGIILRYYPNLQSSYSEVLYTFDTVYIDYTNSTLTFYCVKNKATGTIGYVTKTYVSVNQEL